MMKLELQGTTQAGIALGYPSRFRFACPLLGLCELNSFEIGLRSGSGLERRLEMTRSVRGRGVGGRDYQGA